MDQFKNLPLLAGTTGHLYLHNMPGRPKYERMSDFLDAARSLSLDGILCLCGMDEIRVKSPEYARAVGDGSLPCSWKAFPITDFGVPSNEAAFKVFVLETAESLRSGETLLLHCGAGIGRTGMTAACILEALGLSADQANKVVRAVGSGAETPEQRALVKRFHTI